MVTRLSLQPSLEPRDYRFTHTIRARFSETDAMGIIHHSSYLPWLEEARAAFLDHVGHSYEEFRQSGIDFAVLEAYIQYRQPVRFHDLVEVHLMVGAVTRVTFQLAYLVTVASVACTTAVTVHGAVDREGRPERLPKWIAPLAP